MISQELIESTRSAKAAADVPEQKHRDELRRLAELKLQQRDCDTQRGQLRTDEERDAATRMLDGEDAAPIKTRRVNKLAKLDSDAPALAAAIARQEQRVADAAVEASAPKLPLVGAVLAIVGELQNNGIEQAKAKLAELVPALALLVAADQVRLALIGERFAIPRDTVPPFAGLPVSRKLCEAIPERLRPAELDQTQLLNAAREISAEIVAQIRG